MALVGANRVSQLCALDLRFCQYRSDGVHFEVPSLGKKRIVGAPPRQIMFGSFQSDKRLRIVECMKCYEDKTKQFRPKIADDPNPVFISYIKPHKAIISQRLANWIKVIREEPGIDTTTFKAHSVRGASSTAAVEKGVMISDILQKADWSRESTFKRFYCRPRLSNSDNYSQRVLQQKERGGTVARHLSTRLFCVVI